MMPMRLRQIELRAPIASGGMGTVYRAYDIVLQREVAVKLMKPELVNEPDAMESFYREARACASLNHTNIIHIYAFDEEGPLRYLVMELAEHGSVDSRIDQDGRMTELEVLDVGIKVGGALDAALKHKLLHLDIKPGNILFNADNEPKLVDFGLARSAEEQGDSEATAWGTPYYVAPEKIKREPETFLSDMYSLGGTLYHALTGHVPFEAPTVDEVVSAHVHQALTPPIQVVPDVSQDTSDAIARAMAKLPEERFQSYDEFIMALTASRSELLVRMYNQPATGDSGGRGWWKH
jgi:serine/threonine-protein kinase